MDDHDLTALALAARDGNRLALGAFIRQTQAEVWRACARLSAPNHADDLTQEVYVRMMRSLPGFRGESSVRTWLFAITRNTVADSLRSRNRRERLWQRTSPVNEQEHPNHSVEPDHSVEVMSLISCLEQTQREAFVLTQVVGLSYDEAAAACCCPVGTIRSRVARARSRLLEALNVSEESTCGLAARTKS